MTELPSPSVGDVGLAKVSDELLSEFSDAKARFHDAETTREQAVDGTDFDHEQKVIEKTKELIRAEKDLEAVTDRIGGALKAT